MTEQAPPTFKLVLVGDGGTGKVRKRRSLRKNTSFFSLQFSQRGDSDVFAIILETSLSLRCQLGSHRALINSTLSPPLPRHFVNKKMENICPTLASPAQRHR